MKIWEFIDFFIYFYYFYFSIFIFYFFLIYFESTNSLWTFSVLRGRVSFGKKEQSESINRFTPPFLSFFFFNQPPTSFFFSLSFAILYLLSFHPSPLTSNLRKRSPKSVHLNQLNQQPDTQTHEIRVDFIAPNFFSFSSLLFFSPPSPFFFTNN